MMQYITIVTRSGAVYTEVLNLFGEVVQIQYQTPPSYAGCMAIYV